MALPAAFSFLLSNSSQYFFKFIIIVLVCLKATKPCSSIFLYRTRIAFEVKLQKTSRSTDFRVPQSICTMFNVMVDAKAQSTKLCSMEMGQEVKMQVLPFTAFKGNVMKFPVSCCARFRDVVSFVDLAFHRECADECTGGCSQI